MRLRGSVYIDHFEKLLEVSLRALSFSAVLSGSTRLCGFCMVSKLGSLFKAPPKFADTRSLQDPKRDPNVEKNPSRPNSAGS